MQPIVSLPPSSPSDAPRVSAPTASARRSGAPERVVYTTSFESPIGTLRVASTSRGLARLELPGASGRGFAGWLRTAVPDADLREAAAPNREAIRQVLEYLSGRRTAFDLPLDLRGTPFQMAVWRALLGIPYGAIRSYAEVARAIHRPNAVRAVGSANGANPIALVVPCHRVIASGGRLGGYGGGLDLKRRLLAMEQSIRHQDGLL
jgi:O-6-methylguanine DNA methyltransferase